MAKMLHVTIQTNRFEEEIAFYEKEAGLTLQRDMRPKKDLVLRESERELRLMRFASYHRLPIFPIRVSQAAEAVADAP